MAGIPFREFNREAYLTLVDRDLDGRIDSLEIKNGHGKLTGASESEAPGARPDVLEQRARTAGASISERRILKRLLIGDSPQPTALKVGMQTPDGKRVTTWLGTVGADWSPRIMPSEDSFRRALTELPPTRVTPAERFSSDRLAVALSSKQPIGIRRELNAVMAEFGMVSRDVLGLHDGTRPDAANYRVFDLSPYRGGHTTAGEIRLKADVHDTALEALRAEQALTRPQVQGLRSLVHETLHGYSPASSSVLDGDGQVLEHLATEAAAWGVLMRRFGASPSQLRNPRRFGVEQAVAYIQTSAEVVGIRSLSYAAALDILVDASMNLYSSSDEPETSEKGLLRRFVRQFQLPAEAIQSIPDNKGVEANNAFRREMSKRLRLLKQYTLRYQH